MQNFPSKWHIQYTIILLLCCNLYAQKNKSGLGFKEYYPIAERPYFASGLGNNTYETILIDARPVVYYGLFNNIKDALASTSTVNGNAFYLTVQPQFRIYLENSKPVKTPSYKAFAGWQKMFRTRGDNFFTVGLESGHYSNGQSMATFSKEVEDNTPESRAIYETFTDDTDLAALLNRSSGNFSTNLTRLSANYRINNFNADNSGKNIHSLTLTYQLYHNRFFGIFKFAGYDRNDIEIYGRHQIEAGYEYTHYFKKGRLTVGQEVFLHWHRHPSADFYRSETTAIYFPWPTELGFFAKFAFGFDDYNTRFLDSFPRLSLGLSWDWFTPFLQKRKTQD